MTEPADRASREPSRSSREGPPDGESLLQAVLGLPWVAPAPAWLLHLARQPESSWSGVRQDPGAVLLLLRSTSSEITSPYLPFPHSLLEAAEPLETAVALLEHAKGYVDWNEPRLRPVYEGALTLARLTRTLAVISGKAHAEQAWCAGLLSPLGWLALAAVAPGSVAATLLDSSFSRDPAGTTERHLGVDPLVIGRRLIRQWGLPGWIGGILTHLDLPLDHAQRFGVDRMLFSLTRIAVRLARQRGIEVAPALEGDLEAEQSVTGLRLTDLENLEAEGEAEDGISWSDPKQQPLLREVLLLAIETRRLRKTPRVAQLEAELDNLHAVLAAQIRGEGERLRAAKLSGLAEFAAGASHEINNPLAVISGQAQYILGHENDWLSGDNEGGARQALQTIIQQTKRVHTILRDLMQFARPAPPRPSWLDLPTMLGEVAGSLEEISSSKRVRIEVTTRPDRLAILADAEQVRSALLCLVRNAVEAVPVEGWVRLVLIEPGPAERVEVFIEDSGPGPAPEQRPHLFDPFYSGRSAGRGRGLGLPLAWRLARQQGGDVHLEPSRPGQPTRFVLSLPRHPHPSVAAA